MAPHTPYTLRQFFRISLPLTVVALFAGTGSLRLAIFVKHQQWFGATEYESFQINWEYAVVFSTVLLGMTIANMAPGQFRFRSWLLAAIVTLLSFLFLSLVAAIQLSSALSGGPTSSGHVLLATSIVGYVLVATCAVHFIPRSSAPVVLSRLLLDMGFSFLILTFFLVPWQLLLTSRLSDEERHERARSEFGRLYEYGYGVIEQCEARKTQTGELSQLVISTRRSTTDQQRYFDSGYYDFDYQGANRKGRVTVSLQLLKEIDENDPDKNSPRQESITGRQEAGDFQVLIYPEYSDTFLTVLCPHPEGLREMD